MEFHGPFRYAAVAVLEADLVIRNDGRTGGCGIDAGAGCFFDRPRGVGAGTRRPQLLLGALVADGGSEALEVGGFGDGFLVESRDS